MQQRVGIARALANYPSVLLMDELFGALDTQTSVMMQESSLQIWSEFGTTVLFITHDVDEALFLADRVLIMSASPGRIIADLAVSIARPRTPDIATDDDHPAQTPLPGKNSRGEHQGVRSTAPVILRSSWHARYRVRHQHRIAFTFEAQAFDDPDREFGDLQRHLAQHIARQM